MKNISRIIRPSPDDPARVQVAHHLWMALALTGLGCFVGLRTLVFSVYIYEPLPEDELLQCFSQNLLFPVMNCLAPVLLIWLFYLLTGRAWIAYICCALPVAAIAIGNYYKVPLRSDPLLATDLRLALEAGSIANRYDLTPTGTLLKFLACLGAGVIFAVVLMPQGVRNRRVRLYWGASCLALCAVALAGPYSSDKLYNQVNTDELVNPNFSAEVYLSRGCVYSFLHSVKDMAPAPPPGYDKEEAAAAMAQYPDHDIPEDQKVSVMGIMLESLCIMTDMEQLTDHPGVTQIYESWHVLEEQGVSGRLLANSFGGGTINTEQAFLTGLSAHEDFRQITDSYVWYFRDQGYQTFGSHPNYGWFYNRQNANQYLGFQDYWFAENYYAERVTPADGVVWYDPMLVQELLGQLKERIADGPCFSFTVTYQNHGPYNEGPSSRDGWVTSDNSDLTETSQHILNYYLSGIFFSIGAMMDLTQGLEEMDEPVVLVLFGDHKPWLRDVYTELGINLDLSTEEGFYNYYSVPYLIWPNSAARKVLGRSFSGQGGDMSPCFLMTELFDQCGWEGPGFMALSREMREITPLIHESGRFWSDGILTNTLEGDGQEFYNQFRRLEYYRERESRK